MSAKETNTTWKKYIFQKHSMKHNWYMEPLDSAYGDADWYYSAFYRCRYFWLLEMSVLQNYLKSRHGEPCPVLAMVSIWSLVYCCKSGQIQHALSTMPWSSANVTSFSAGLLLAHNTTWRQKNAGPLGIKKWTRWRQLRSSSSCLTEQAKLRTGINSILTSKLATLKNKQ